MVAEPLPSTPSQCPLAKDEIDEFDEHEMAASFEPQRAVQIARAIDCVRKFKQQSSMDEILPNLFLGSYTDARDVPLLTRNNVKAVVSIMEAIAYPKDYDRLGIQTLSIPLPDSPNSSLNSHFEQAIEFIHAARCRKESVLVHCMVGMSRSPAIVVGYLMFAAGLTMFNALSLIRSKRPKVDPNYGFRLQLAKFELEIEEFRLKFWSRNLQETCKKQWEIDRAETKRYWITQPQGPIGSSTESKQEAP